MPKAVASDWVSTPFGALCQRIVNGGTPETDIPSYWGGDTPWITGADFTPHGLGEFRRYVSELGIRASATSVVKQSNLLVVTRTGVGKLAIAPCDIAISQDITGIYIDPQKADTEFVYYLLSRELDELKKLNQGTSINGIVRGDLEKHSVSIPRSTAVQRKLVAILRSIDTALERAEALIAKHQRIKAGLMHDLFTRGVLPNGQLRPNRSEAPELYQETAIGWIPMGWQPSTLRQCLIDSPTNGIYKPAEKIGEGLLMVGQTAFTEQRSIDFALCRRGDVDKEEARRYGLAKDDILVTRVFATIEGVGLPTLVPQLIEPAVFESNMMRLRIDTGIVKPRLLFEWLQSPIARRHITGGANASNQCSVNQGVLNPLPVALPPLDEQTRITARIELVDRQREAIIESLSKLKMQKLGLMQDLLTRRVSVEHLVPELENA